MNTPYYLLRGGDLYGSTLGAAGSFYYWSSTPNSSKNAYYLYLYLGYPHVDYDDRYYGNSVRCVAAG